MSSRRDEILAKKARLAELKRQREERQQQFATSRPSLGAEVRQWALSCRITRLMGLTRHHHRESQPKNGALRSTTSYQVWSTDHEIRPPHHRQEEVDQAQSLGPDKSHLNMALATSPLGLRCNQRPLRPSQLEPPQQSSKSHLNLPRLRRST
jgi:hypothetical protein